jgi:hypothetical protein
MMTDLRNIDLDESARKAAGNWRTFGSFCWHRARDLDDADNWAIFYTHHRDSSLIDQSNAKAIAKALQPFMERDDPDVIAERHNHWAVGRIDGFAVRVFRNGEVTDAFRTYRELARRLADYSILDEDDYSRREYECALQTIGEAAWRLKRTHALPEGWEAQVYSWLADHNPAAVENRDDQGRCPCEKDLEAAFRTLGYARVD